MASKTRFWNAVLVLLSAANVVSVWFAAVPGEAAHATAHAALALVFGLWAHKRINLGAAPLRALDEGSEAEIAALNEEVGDLQRTLDDMRERLDFTERLLNQSREADRLPDRREI